LFEEVLAENLTKRVGDKWKQYGLKNLLNTVIDIAELGETINPRWTVRTGHLVKVLKSERQRIERIQEWNKRSADQTK
jgi:hypothetical protein